MTFDAYLEQRPELAPSTRRLYARIARRWAVDGLDTWIAAALTPDTPAGTATPIRAAVKLWCAWSEREPPGMGRLARNAGAYVDALDRAELRAFLAAIKAAGIPDRARLVLEILPWTGLRISEACSLRRDAVVLRGEPGIQLRSGAKGGKHRWVPLGKQGVKTLRAALALAPGAAFVFPGGEGGAGHIPASGVRHHLQTVRAALPEDFPRLTPHVLRHTWASEAINRGVPLPVVQRILGHAQITTTQRYVHPSRRALADAIDKVED